MSEYLSEQILAFYMNLRVPERLPKGVEVLYLLLDTKNLALS